MRERERRKREWTREILLGKLADVEDRLLYAPLVRDIIDIGALEREKQSLLQKLEEFKELDDVRNLSTILRHPAALISEHFSRSPSSRQADLSRPPLAAAGVWDKPERSVRGCGHTPLVESPVVAG